MAVKQAEQQNFLNTPILGLVLENLSADPAIRPAGSLYWNTTDGAARASNGAAWTSFASASSETGASILAKLLSVDGDGSGLDADLVDGMQGSALLARANHTGTQAAVTISDFNAAVQSVLVTYLDVQAASDAYDTWAEVTAEMVADDSALAALITTVGGKAVSGRTATFGNGALTTFSLANPRGINAQARCVTGATGAVDVVPRIVVTATTFEVTFTNYVPAANEFAIAYVG